MVASTVTPPSAQPPPDVPSMPSVPPVLPDYLRRFSLWCRNGFADRFGLQSATPHVYMTSPIGNVFKISVMDSGLLLSTTIAPGTGRETEPIMSFAPVITATSVSRTHNAPASTSSSSYQMVGIGLSFNPAFETQAIAIATGMISNSVVNGETDVVVCFGTGTAPVAGAALTGTRIGGVEAFTALTAGAAGGFIASGGATPLNPATPYWFDLAIKTIGGSGTISAITMTVSGLP